jgi:hypothetical protein
LTDIRGRAHHGAELEQGVAHRDPDVAPLAARLAVTDHSRELEVTHPTEDKTGHQAPGNREET